MRKALTILALLAALGRGEIIDRVAARVGSRVITRSEVEKEARLEAYFNRQPPPDKAADHSETLQRVIKQQLVRRSEERRVGKECRL